MKNYLLLCCLSFFLLNCSSSKNKESFINSTQGRYLFNANEVLEIYFKEKEMFVKWRGKENIMPLKLNDSSFYMKELNEKLLFTNTPEISIKLAEKTEHKGIKYVFRKMKVDEKTASEYFNSKNYEKAFLAYQKIKEKDSLNPIIRRRTINKLGYQFIRNKNLDAGLEIFKINAKLYPNNSTVFNSLGEAYFLQKDTVNALLNFEKSISINPENTNSKRFLKKLTKTK